MKLDSKIPTGPIEKSWDKARFELKPAPLVTHAGPALAEATSLEAFLDQRDAAGLPVLFDFANYEIEGVLCA